MRALVTGGAGFIGSNLVDALLERGDDVAVVDDLSSGKESNLAAALDRGARLHRADIRDAEAMAEIAGRERPELIFHLAAQIDVRVSVARPAYDARTNVEGTINMLEAAREAGTKRFVFSSTGGAIYGETEVVPTPEGTDPRADGRLRAVEVLRRGLPRALRAAARAVDGRAALRQRLRPAAGPARRGRASSRSSAARR